MEDNSKLNVRPATIFDVDSIFNLLTSCAHWLANQGLTHWLGAIKRDSITEAISRHEVFLLFFDGVSAGTVTLSKIPRDYEKGEFWAEPVAPALYIYKLAVLPEFQSKGLATKLIVFAESTARSKGIKYLRFDAVSNYQKLNEFYVKRGFVLVGKKIVRGSTPSNFYEKQIQ